MALTIAECIAGGGDYLDEIIDIAWAICEETSWVVPAHNNQSGTPPRSLPDIEAPVYIDLFSAETGSALTWVYYFLGDAIAERAPLARRRIEIEMKKRILDPYLDDDSFGWKGLAHGDPVNNWNPWINSNILTAFLIMEQDCARRAEGVLRTAKSTQRFLDFYFPDGGCDEGPSYFGVAGASLFDYLEEIYYGTGGAVDLYGDPLIANIAKYIYRVHAGGEYYVNFADAPPRVGIAAGLLSRVGAAIGDGALVQFCGYMQNAGLTKKPYEGGYGQLYRLLSNIFQYKTPCSDEAFSYVAPRDHFFEGIQVMTARRQADSTDGIFVAFKGGHNAESHNHNDVGSYVIYKDGKPIVVDAGVETYTRFTFSDQRYNIWTMRSDYHNLPDINGCTQFPGAGAKASGVGYNVTDGFTGGDTSGFGYNLTDGVAGGDTGGITEMSLDIAGAYPKEAAVKSYRRALRFDRCKSSVTVRDEFELEKAVKPLINHIMCFNKPEIVKNGEICLGGLTLAYDPATFDASVERIALTDPKIKADWQKDELFRILLTAKTAECKGSFTFEFTSD
jgi:hypothetical protein